MTSKQKALELWEKYFRLNYDWDGGTKDEWAKEGALIAVDEMISGYEFDSLDIEHKRIIDNINFWDKVKQEIEKL